MTTPLGRLVYDATGLRAGSAPALTVGLDAELLSLICVSPRTVGQIQMPVDNDEIGVELKTCTPRAAWSRLWPQVRHSD